MPARFSRLLFPISLIAAVAAGCAGGLPAVVSSNPSRVSVEFELEGSVTEAGELAAEECKKYGKVSEYQAVDTIATPNSRIANFDCIAPADGVGAPASGEK
jgi:hypothetical protein